MKGTAMQNPINDPLIQQRINYYSRIKRVVLYMQNNTSEPIDLNKAASLACMERTAFSKFFSKAMGMTFQDFVQQWRVSEAAALMLTSDRSLADLAFSVGFSTLASFERTFKKVTSSTPSNYRKRLLEHHAITPMTTNVDQLTIRGLKRPSNG
jgi:transcriptional regulator GlxA family with amidase domain